MRIDCVFIDNGVVITDNSRRGPQYAAFVVQYFPPRLGGTPEAWVNANLGTYRGAWQRFLERIADWHAHRDLKYEMLLYYADWLRSMYRAMGVEAPADDVECGSFARDFEYWINPQIEARFPGVDAAIELLSGRYRLFTASDGFARPLADAIGPSAAAFERLYGPEIVNVPKSVGLPYYAAVFANAGVDPARCLVVDDKSVYLAVARTLGARTLRVGAGPALSADEPVIASLAELPGRIDAL